MERDKKIGLQDIFVTYLNQYIKDYDYSTAIQMAVESMQTDLESLNPLERFIFGWK